MSIIPDAISESLDYSNLRRRAVASRSYRVKLSSSNGQTFSPGQTIFMDFPSNLAGTYLDPTQCYLRLNVTYTNVAGANSTGYLTKAGALGLVQRLQILTSGQNLADINNYNVLAGALLDMDSSAEWRANVGSVLLGTTASAPRGEYISAGSSRNYCIPLVLNPLSMQQKLVPLFSMDSLKFRFTLDTNANALIQSDIATNIIGYSITEAELVCYFTELSPSAQMQVNEMCGGVYNLLCPCYMNAQNTLTANATQLTSTLGFAVSSLERILVIHRNAASAVGNADSLTARCTAGISSLQFFINSEPYPARAMNFNDVGAEMLAEMLISDHSLSNFQKPSMLGIKVKTAFGTYGAVNTSVYVNPNEAYFAIVNPSSTDLAWNNVSGAGTQFFSAATGANDTNIGTFIASCELESGVSANFSQKLYSGVSTISSVVQGKTTYSGTNATFTVDYFAHYTILLTLDMNRLGVWTVSI